MFEGSTKFVLIITTLDETWTPIVFCLKRVQLSNGVTISKKQIPLACAESLTIHKSQGGTYDFVKLKISKKIHKQTLYVVLGRVKKLNGIFIQGSLICPRSKDAALELH